MHMAYTSDEYANNDPNRGPSSNAPEMSVSDISRHLKRTVEDAYSYVRVRGEISGFKRAASGHLYMALKDENAVIDGVCWRGTAQRLATNPEDGLEVIVTGKLTTYPGRSKYQIVIEAMEPAGEGALLKLLEDRKKKLEEEGLFDPARKKPIPFLPDVIGVVTSPTGAVIRDILHRLADRFPRRVLLYPVMVQGDGAADQIAAAIHAFNNLQPDGTSGVPRPDLLIVARGGGSLEDLWAFNEEVVIRAAAASEIPLISAVGHETDVTLIDFASDKRAPTPTAAAEMAVPVRRDLAVTIRDLDRRALSGLGRHIDRMANHVEGLGRGLPDALSLVNQRAQRLDESSERLALALKSQMRFQTERVKNNAARLRSPRQLLALQAERLGQKEKRLDGIIRRSVDQTASHYAERGFEKRLHRLTGSALKNAETTLINLSQRMENVSHASVLKRGFALIRDEAGHILKTRDAAQKAGLVTIEMQDGLVEASTGQTTASVPNKKLKPVSKPKPTDRQGSLL